jgi:hypothetical protein
MTQYRAEQVVAINGWDCGTEIELKMVVTFKVHPGSPATHVDPPEYPAAEVEAVRFFEIKAGNTAAVERSIPDWVVERMTQDGGFEKWLLSEAGEQHQSALEGAADAKRERDLDNDLPF